ncbi:hypothetical protein Pcinc_038769 [Petrolisthes cinctipes]|uniref:Uncharacterized protein n=1 Tax=Petrolisthes cinctipes TaxID=88211 RepID=A0AAE1BTP8_PETCI|nr:hypothetical protein Pcinc_038769 [Petrolisthes cinctipes]
MARRRPTHNLHSIFLGIVFVCLSTVTLLDLSLLKFSGGDGGGGVGPPRVSTGRTIYLVTNTWARPSQMANMVQLAQTLCSLCLIFTGSSQRRPTQRTRCFFSTCSPLSFVLLISGRRRANFAWTTQFGEEDIVARLGVKEQDLELMAQQCTKRLDEEQYDDTNLRLLQQYLWRPPDPASLTTTTTTTATPSSSSSFNNTNISEEDDYYDSSSLANSTDYYYDDDDDGQNYEY